METTTIEISKIKNLKEELIQGRSPKEKESIVCKMREIFGTNIIPYDNIIERVKTLEDAIDELGESHPFVKDYRRMTGLVYRFSGDMLAYARLRIVVAALNEGWIPAFTEDELRWYPWFVLYTQEEIDRMDDKDKSKLCLWGGSANGGSYCGCAFSHSNYAFSYSRSYIGSRLVLKSEELSNYCGRQFISLWKDFFIGQDVEEKGGTATCESACEQ